MTKILKRLPRDVNARAVAIARTITGEDENNIDARPIEKIDRMKARAAKGGSKRAAKLTKDERSTIARKAASARWTKVE